MRDIGPGMVVRLYRSGKPVGFWEGEQAVVRPGDILLEIEPNLLSGPNTDN